jgi:response regulator NasT
MQHGRILIADDDAVLRMDLRAMLEAIGHCVVAEAVDGGEACALARSLGPDLIILDVMMPTVDGLQAAETISKERLGPVVLLTAYSEIGMIERANKAGVLAYIVKPFHQRDLQPAIEIAMARYREMQALEGALDAAQDQIDTGRMVAQAKRILVDRLGVSDQEALRRLQAQALSTNKPLREVAEAILLTEDLGFHRQPSRR